MRAQWAPQQGRSEYFNIGEVELYELQSATEQLSKS